MSGITKNLKNISLCLWQWFPIVGQCILFPLEVGARGYCFTNVKSCLMRLGCSSNLVKSTLKSLCLTSLTVHLKFGCVKVLRKQWLKAQELQQIKRIMTAYNLSSLGNHQNHLKRVSIVVY